MAFRCPARSVPLLLLLALPLSLDAQVRASERGSVSQTIDGTVITVDYSRPQVRGRSPLFGGVEHWGAVWTPGANFATTIEVNRPIKLDGHPVEPGKYSLWYVLQPNEWTVVLDPRWRKYHVPYPDSTGDQLRYTVRPGTGPFTEMLTFSFQDVHGEEGTLLFRWGTTELAMHIAVEPKHKLTLDASEAQPFVGSYLSRWAGAPETAPASRVTLVYENEMLMGKWVPAPWPEAATLLLVKLEDDAFMVGTWVNGELTDLMDEWVFEFKRKDGKVTSFEIWTDGDQLDATAMRE